MSDNVVVELAGRGITFKRPAPGQIVMLLKLTQHARQQADSNPDALMDLTVKTLTMIESLIISDEDRAHVEAAMLRGEIEFEQLREAVLPAKAPAKKAAPKAAAKTVAAKKRVRR